MNKWLDQREVKFAAKIVGVCIALSFLLVIVAWLWNCR